MAQEYHKLLNNPEIIEWAKRYLKRSDRIFWYLKKVKEDPSIHPSEELKHFFAMNIPKINEYQLIHQSFPAACMQLRRYETKFNLKTEENVSLIDIEFEKEKTSVVLTLPRNWYWVKLDTFFCKKEARAMGHCGNSTGNATDQILSLRRKISKGDKTYWEPHLTFILSKDGVLGEMKGKQNVKPQERYHEQILELLKEPWIKKIEGGGYLPENNFKILDFSEEHLNLVEKYFQQKLLPKTQFVLQNRQNLEIFTYKKNQDFFEEEELLNYLKRDEKKLLYLGINGSESLAIAALRKVTSLNFLIEAAQFVKEESRLSELGAEYPWHEEKIRDQKQLLKLYHLGLVRKSSNVRYLSIQGVTDSKIMKEMLIEELTPGKAQSYILSELILKVPANNFWNFYEEITQKKSYKKKLLLPYLSQEQLVEILLKDSLEIKCTAVKQINGPDFYIRLIEDNSLPKELKRSVLQSLHDNDFLAALIHGSKNELGIMNLESINGALKLFSHPLVQEEIPIKKWEEMLIYLNSLKHFMELDSGRLRGVSIP